jgi:oxaloacetate decarboxylase alpha subunit
VNKEIQKKAAEGDTPITCRPADNIPPEMEKLKREVGAWALQPEDILSYAMFPQVAKDFLPKKYARVTKTNIGLDTPIAEEAYPV